MKKLLIFGIIALFGGLAFIPSFNAVSISILENHPPEAPDIKGPITRKPGIIYDYTFKAIDPDGDAVRYFIDWDDGNTEWTEYCSSSEEIVISHTWIENKFHRIGARANDTHGALGPWGYLQVSREYKNDITSDSEEDCIDCQFNNNPLAEKLLNRLEKDKVLSNVINSNNPDDRPICFLLENIYAHYAEIAIKYYELAYSYSYGSPIFLFYFSLAMAYGAIVAYIEHVGWFLGCWDHIPPNN